MIYRTMMDMTEVCCRKITRMISGFSLIYHFSSSYSVGVSRGALSIGLGKRLLQEENVERRSGAQRYNFGLGR